MTILALTGAPGIGKTTAVILAAGTLKDRGLTVGGIISRELRFNTPSCPFVSRLSA
jgi:nucleoside-triphosphatase THEP1